MLDSLVRVTRRVGRSTDSLHAARASTRTEWGKGKRGKPDDPPERRRLGSTAASDPTPDLGRPRRRDRRGSKTRAPGDPRTGALENDQPRPTSRARKGRTRRRFLPGPGPQTPIIPTRRGDLLRGEDRPPAPGRRRAALPTQGSFGTRPPEREVATRPLPSPGRPTN